MLASPFCSLPERVTVFPNKLVPILKPIPIDSSAKESTCQCRRGRFNPWVGKIPWRRKWQSNPIFLPGKSYGQRSRAGYLLHMNTHILHSAAKGDKGAFLIPHSLDSGVRETILNNQYYLKWYID